MVKCHWFKDDESIRKASSEGFILNGHIHRGVVNLNSKDDVPKLMRVTLNQIPTGKNGQDLITKLSQSLTSLN
ncbi:unnamed protein product [Cunninghamella echinulata]